VVDRTVFVGSHDNNLYAVDTDTAEQKWVFETGDIVRSSPTVVDGTVFIGSNDNNLYAIDSSMGEQEWAFETGGAVGSSPTVVDGTVFIRSGDDNLYALDADVSGSSEGSRVNLGTLGHHHTWADRSSSDDGKEEDRSDSPTIEDVSYYADAETGIVGPGGLGDAASNFRSGEIGPTTLGEVAAAFRSGKPVV
jgi:hypothetical protein